MVPLKYGKRGSEEPAQLEMTMKTEFLSFSVIHFWSFLCLKILSYVLHNQVSYLVPA